MPLKLLPLPQAEWPRYYQICWTAFVPGVMEMMYPQGFSAAAMQHSIAAQKRKETRYPDRVKFLQVIDTDLPADDEFGRVVGVSQWIFYPNGRTEEEMQREREVSEQDEKEFGDAPGMDMKAVAAFRSAVNEYIEKYIGRAAHVHLQAIGTRAGHERRGIAGLSLRWGTEKADDLHLPAFLEATEKGAPLYKRFGFELVEAIPYDATKHGYSLPLPHVFMKRPAKA